MALPVGTRLGPYETLSLLGIGGMGEVYRARDTKLKRDVALKILPAAFAQDPGRMARFQREAEVLASLNHPNIAQIYGVEDRALVMELVEGESPKGPLPFEEAWKIAFQIAQALEYAHEKGIVHRDLKPDNVKVTADGVVKLLDFGLAKALSASPEDTSQDPESFPTVTAGATVAGAIMGTPAYMAPEQAKGKPVDKRADIWAWGVMLFELLTGDKTFKGESVAEMLSQVLTVQPDLERVPPRVRRLLRRCLEKDPRQRLRDMGDARDLLEEPAEVSAPVPSYSRFGRFGWIAAGAMALIAIAALWAPWRGRPASAPVARLSMELAPAEALGPAPFFARPVYTSIALSPDGRTLVFAGISGRQLQLYKRALDQNDASSIPGTDRGSEPFFSPDGQWVGFFAGAKLRKVPLNGGPASDICETSDARSRAWGGSFGASWTSNDTILFAEGRQGIMQVPASGGTPQVLIKPDPAKGTQDSYRTPQLLPDGRTLLFTSLPNVGDWPDAEIIAGRLDNGEQHSLIKGGADARYVPTGHLIYVQHSVLMAVPFDVKRAQLAGSPVAMLDRVMQSMYVPNGAVDTGMAQFAISSSGHLAYASGGVSPPFLNAMIRVDRKGAEQEIKIPKDQYLGARVSPDGQRVVLARTGSSTDIWLVDINSGNLTRVTSEGGAWPLWSPDGKRILFSRGSQFVTSAVDGNGSVEPVMTIKAATYPASWSPDGKWLAYMESQDGISRIWTKPMTGSGEPTKLLESKFTIRDADFSPDGHWIVYTSNEAGPSEVYVQAFPGPGEKHKISNAGGVNPAWARNGRELFYLEPRGGKLALMTVEFAPNGVFKPATPHMLFEPDWGTTSPVRSYDVTPDGKYFIAYRPEAPPDEPVRKLNIVLNWFDELNNRAPRSGR